MGDGGDGRGRPEEETTSVGCGLSKWSDKTDPESAEKAIFFSVCSLVCVPCPGFGEAGAEPTLSVRLSSPRPG